MRRTYCTAKMTFVDVKAHNDANITYTPNIGNTTLFDDSENVDLGNVASTELNMFVLDGGKVLPSNIEEVAFLSESKSKDDCTFAENPKLTIDFTENHTSAGITLYFGTDYPKEVKITWYSLNGQPLRSGAFYPDSKVYICKAQEENYGKLEIEFVKTRYPRQFASLQYIVYGLAIDWKDDTIASANVLEEVNPISDTLSINTANVSIIDVNNDFDISNQNGAWKSVQRSQKIDITEYIDGKPLFIGAFYIKDHNFSDNKANFSLVDTIGLMDYYTFYDGDIYSGKNAGELLEEIFSACEVSKYSIDEELYSISLNGYLAIQSCRNALQMVCFATGAVADDSRSDYVKVYMPNKYVNATIGTNRKFNGTTTLSLDEYVSGVSIGYKRHTIDSKASDIFKGKIVAGNTKIAFNSPYSASTITSTAGNIIEKHTNYLVINSNVETDVVISGVKYNEEEVKYITSVDHIEAGEVENVKEFSGCTLYNDTLLKKIANNILDYYSLRKSVSLNYILEDEKTGDWSNVATQGGYSVTTLIESQNINLTGGFTSQATCKGYTRVMIEDVFAGSELFTGGDMIL